MLRFACVVTVLAGCTTEMPAGIAYIRLTEMDGTCGINEPGGADASDADKFMAQFEDLPYRRVHATAAFRGGGTFDGGHAITIPWQDEDGTISRLFIAVGPNRGYGATMLPNTSSLIYEQSTGLVEWQGGERRFAAKSAIGYLAYTMSNDNEDDRGPGHLYTMLAFDGVGPAGQARCRIAGVHATTSHDRFENYDPAWLEFDPSAMIVDRSVPTHAGDTAPSANLVAPEEAASDPGSPPPQLGPNSPPVLSNGASGGGACD